MQAQLCRSQFSLQKASPSVRPVLGLRPNAVRAVAVRAQKEQRPAVSLADKTQMALMPVSLAVAELLMHPSMAQAAEEPGRLFDCE